MQADCKEAAYTCLLPVSSDHWSLNSNLSLNVVFSVQSPLDCICCMSYGFPWCRTRSCSCSEPVHEFHDFFRTYLFLSWAIQDLAWCKKSLYHPKHCQPQLCGLCLLSDKISYLLHVSIFDSQSRIMFLQHSTALEINKLCFAFGSQLQFYCCCNELPKNLRHFNMVKE